MCASDYKRRFQSGTHQAPTPQPRKLQMESPCIDISTIDPEKGLCTGCGRTLQEIADWSSKTDAERRRIMLELPQRMRAAGLSTPAEG